MFKLNQNIFARELLTPDKTFINHNLPDTKVQPKKGFGVKEAREIIHVAYSINGEYYVNILDFLNHNGKEKNIFYKADALVL